MKNLYNYKDYRLFLNDYIDDQKKHIPSFSIAQLAKKLNLSHTSSLNKVLRGQRNPGDELTKSLCAYFNFSPEEEGYFIDLVSLEKESNPIQKAKLLNRINKLVNRNIPNILPDNHFSLISNWYSYALIEMCRLKDFTFDFNWISSRLKNKVSSLQIEETINRLVYINLININDDKIELNQNRHQTTTDIPNEYIKEYHEESIKKGIDAIREETIERRYISSSTIAVKKDSIHEAKKLIDQFQDNLSLLVESNDSADDIYMLNIQYFPVTKESE